MWPVPGIGNMVFQGLAQYIMPPYNNNGSIWFKNPALSAGQATLALLGVSFSGGACYLVVRSVKIK
jgi:hypothetical protein